MFLLLALRYLSQMTLSLVLTLGLCVGSVLTTDSCDKENAAPMSVVSLGRET